MKTSIIIPVYNKIEIVQDCILLNIKHAFEPCHWLIIDNNSDEKTKKGLLELQSEAQKLGHSFEIVTETKNTGVAIAWNKGLRLVTSEYVCILNNDCVMMPNWDKRLIEFDQQNIFKIFTPFVLETHILKNYTLEMFLSGNQNYLTYLKKNKNINREGIFGGVVFFGKKANFDFVGKFDERLWLSMEDIDFLWAAIQKNIRVGITGSVLAFHFVSVTRKEVAYDYSKNQSIFEHKWAWNFEKNENSFYNKLIKSWNKFLLKKLKLLGTKNPFMP